LAFSRAASDASRYLPARATAARILDGLSFSERSSVELVCNGWATGPRSGRPSPGVPPQTHHRMPRPIPLAPELIGPSVPPAFSFTRSIAAPYKQLLKDSWIAGTGSRRAPIPPHRRATRNWLLACWLAAASRLRRTGRFPPAARRLCSVRVSHGLGEISIFGASIVAISAPQLGQFHLRQQAAAAAPKPLS